MRMKKAASVISTVILVLLLVAVAVLALPRVFGVRLFSVLTGSMVPAYNVNDIVYVVPAEFEEIKVGDVITYVLDENLTTVTHRVVEIDTAEQRFTTKGDANNTNDANTVMYGNVIGVVRFSIPKAGAITEFADNMYGKIVIIGVIGCFAVLSIALDGGKKKKRNNAAQTDENQPQ